MIYLYYGLFVFFYHKKIMRRRMCFFSVYFVVSLSPPLAVAGEKKPFHVLKYSS